MDFVFFQTTCHDISCSQGRRPINGTCKDRLESGGFTGYYFDVTLLPANSSIPFPSRSLFIRQYSAMLHKKLANFHPLLIPELKINFIIRKDKNNDSIDILKRATVRGKIVTHNQTKSSHIKQALLTILSHDYIHNSSGQHIRLMSRPYICPRSLEDPVRIKNLSDQDSFEVSSGEFLGLGDEYAKNISYQTIQMSCPFVRYTDRFDQPFTFDPLTQKLEFGNYTFFLNVDEFLICGKVLKICRQTIENITEVIFSDEAVKSREPKDWILAILTMICIGLSLVGLFLTFVVYCLVPELRTLPGKNSMALMLHLFVSHLLFLTTSYRTADVVLCRVFGVLLHYFWMASFTWMLICAYHMFIIFTRFRDFTKHGRGDIKRFIVYSVICVVVPIFIVICCLVTHIVQSTGKEIGYGGMQCYLNSPMGVGVFFVAPLIFILLMNAIFFTKTILAIQSVPDMKEASNKSKKRHVVIYIKMSLLLGFTWIFGVLASALESILLQYIFTVLTGCQGFMIFLAYCVNRRTWALLKTRLSSSTF